jgi:hypothetical protein
MKKLKSLKNFNNTLEEVLDEIKNVSKIQTNNIKKEYQRKIFEERLQLISEIAQGENLNELELKEKYLYNKKKKKKSVSKPKVIDSEISLLNVLSYNNEDYYYEDKYNGNVFNTKSEKVGVYMEGKIVFDSS